MKFILSRTKALERKIEAQQTRIDELEAELLKYKILYQRSWKERSPSHDTRTPLVRPAEVEQIPTQSKSYLRPTIASRGRSFVNAQQSSSDVDLSSPETSPSRYHDGVFLKKEDLSEAHFMEPTKAFLEKARLLNYSRWTLSPTESRVEARRDSVTSLFDLEVEDTCIACEKLDAYNVSNREDSLRKRSRLATGDFYSRLESSAFIPFRIQVRLLKSALRLAQETLWCAFRSHWPARQRQHYLEGPEEVRFGRDELETCFGSAMYPGEANAMCDQPRSTVMCHILQVVYLRNAVCHPRHLTCRDVDSLIEKAQGLAVVLLDENRSFKIRKLRDELQAETVRSHEEIERRIGFASLPFGREWAIHHQRYLENVRFESHCYPDENHSSVALQAAKQWQSRYISPGEIDQEYCANVERAKALVREVEEHPPAPCDLDYLYTIPF